MSGAGLARCSLVGYHGGQKSYQPRTAARRGLEAARAPAAPAHGNSTLPLLRPYNGVREHSAESAERGHAGRVRQLDDRHPVGVNS